MVALILGTMLAVAVLAYVLYPVFFPPRTLAFGRSAPLRAQEGDLAVVALREIEFDRATGKLSDADYATLRQRYVDQAVVEMRREGMPGTATSATALSTDPVEAAVLAYRAMHPSCLTCGLRPESDAVYCSECGGFLPGRCAECNATVAAPGSRYCAECGHRLAA